MIRLNNINKIYNQGKPTAVHALKDVTLEIEQGDFIAITGPSGSGKSTLLHILAGLDTPTSGNYSFDELNLSNASDSTKCLLRNEKIGIVLQDFGLLGGETVLRNVMLPLIIRGTKGSEARKKAEIALEKVGIGELINKLVNQLSGGQQQRVAVARVLAMKPQVLLADEPTGALDSQNTASLMDLLEQLNSTGITVVVVTHNIEVAKHCHIAYSIIDGVLSQTHS